MLKQMHIHFPNGRIHLTGRGPSTTPSEAAAKQKRKNTIV